MINDISIDYENTHKQQLNQFLKSKRTNGDYKVIDIGGSVGNWFNDNIDAIMDFFPPKTDFDGTFFKGDITKQSGWDNILEYVGKNGKFDFCICRHTLEDINNPEFVCEMMSKISNEGWIAVPSKYFELAKGVYSRDTRGLHHHRWIFATHKGSVYGLPKMGWTDSFTDEELAPVFANKKSGPTWALELSFFWEKKPNINWLLSIVDNLPDDYCDEYIRGKLRGHPWDVWLSILRDED